MTFKLGSLPRAVAAAKVILDATKPVVYHLASTPWDYSHGFHTVIKRVMACRQHEAMGAAVLLIEANKGECAAPLLRPACEELLWCKYLATLSSEDAEDLLRCFAYYERSRSLQVQGEFATQKDMEYLNLTELHTQSLDDIPHIKTEFQRLATKLNWPPRNQKEGRLPSTAFIAKTVGKSDFYDFLYSATSRYVHFSPFELLRRVWGTPSGKTSISSAHFHDYWAAFVTIYGISLLLETLFACDDELPATLGTPLATQEFKVAKNFLEGLGLVPLVWAWEFTFFRDLVERLKDEEKKK